MEVPFSAAIAALFLELAVLPIRFEIEERQLFFLKRILDKDLDNFEKKWANYISQLRRTYDLPLNDKKISGNQLLKMLLEMMPSCN